MGRPRTPTSQLKLHGSLRSDRHGDRAGEPQYGGIPVPAVQLSGAAAEHWEFVVPKLIETGVAKDIDGPALTMLCQFWAKAQSYLAAGDGEYRIDQSAVMAAKQWRDLASRFGLTAVDRAHIQVGKTEDHDPASKYVC